MTLNDQPPLPILDQVGSVRELGQSGALQFRPVVLMFRELCRHYWQIDPAATTFYINAYRERWDSKEQGGQA